MKIAFVDRDGTINEDYPDHEWSAITAPSFLPGSIEGLKRLVEHGYKVIIVSNQYLIEEGFIRQTQYDLFTAQLVSKLKLQGVELLDIFYCPHARDGDCRCCKPKPGLIEQALQIYPDINLESSFLVGDSACDAELAAYFDLRFYGINIKPSHPKAIQVSSLEEASRRQT